MPVSKCSNGKWKIGSGKCMYDSKEKAEKAYKGYMAHKHMHEMKDKIKILLEDLDMMNKKLEKVKKDILKKMEKSE